MQIKKAQINKERKDIPCAAANTQGCAFEAVKIKIRNTRKEISNCYGLNISPNNSRVES